MKLPHGRLRMQGSRRAFSLLELAAVAAILGIVAVAALSRWGGVTLSVTSGQGFGQQLALAMQLAQRQAIAEGTPAAVVFARSGGQVSSFTIVRAASGGDEAVDETLAVPNGVTVDAPADRWEFDFSGGLTQPVAGGTITVSAASWDWEVTVNALTGHVRRREVHNP